MTQVDDRRLPWIERVAAARIIDVARCVPFLQPVVEGIVQATQAERRAIRASFGGMVEHHVNNHLESGRMQPVDGIGHLLRTARIQVGRMDG